MFRRAKKDNFLTRKTQRKIKQNKIMKKIKNKIMGAFGVAFGACRKRAFCNIAEGTHAGSVTMVAGENIESPNLLVKAGSADNLVLIASAEDAPIGVCGDEGAKGETVGVYLPGSAESTFICVAASSVNMGDSLYTAAGGKVSTVASDGCRKVGVALCSASSGGVVEVDPQGFGERAWQICACGVHVWEGSSSSEAAAAPDVKSSDIVFASISAAGGSEKNVGAQASEGNVTFTLDANGTAGTTKISWIAIRKN